MPEWEDEKYIDIYEKLIRESNAINGFSRSGDKLEHISFATTLGSVEWKGKTYSVSQIIRFLREHEGWVEESSLSFRWVGLEEEEEGAPPTDTQKTFRGIGALVSILVLILVLTQISVPSRSDSSSSANVGTASNAGDEVSTPDVPSIQLYTRYATTEVNMRAGPGTSHEVVDRLRPNESVRVAPDSSVGGWSAVYEGGAISGYRRKGYISSRYLQRTPLPDLELISKDVEWSRYGRASIVGTIRNNSNQTYRYVGVHISIYDYHNPNLQIGTTLDNTRNLRPGDTWRFRANVLEHVEDGGSYRIDEIDGRPVR